jgi:hypothetical protein
MSVVTGTIPLLKRKEIKMDTMINTTNWVTYPFEVNGIKFNSLLDPKGAFYPKVEKLPAGVFIEYNQGAIHEFVGDPTKLTADEIKAKLDLANEFATQALILLAE